MLVTFYVHGYLWVTKCIHRLESQHSSSRQHISLAPDLLVHAYNKMLYLLQFCSTSDLIRRVDSSICVIPLPPGCPVQAVLHNLSLCSHAAVLKRTASAYLSKSYSVLPLCTFQVALFKLYKEYEDGAFSMFGSSGKADLETFVDGGDAVKGALKTYLDTQKQVGTFPEDSQTASQDSQSEDSQ